MFSVFNDYEHVHAGSRCGSGSLAADSWHLESNTKLIVI